MKTISVYIKIKLSSGSYWPLMQTIVVQDNDVTVEDVTYEFRESVEKEPT